METIQQQTRRAYKKHLPGIIKSDGMYDVYSIMDWGSRFSPIENNMWSDIRSVGMRMFPQFPVLGYFIDFADPIRKLGIEVDGKKWHTDADSDKKRQDEIEKEGWTILRFTGAETYPNCREEEYSESGDYEDQIPVCDCVACRLRVIRSRMAYQN